jgi:hypothetical protein
MKKSEFWRSAMYAGSIPEEDLHTALKIIQQPAKCPADATDLQKLRVELIENWWRIYAAWIAYEQRLVDDICRTPYNTPAYRRARSAARLLSAKLKLCEQLCIAVPQPILKGFTPNQQPHQYALGFWVSCMRENKQREIYDLFQEAEIFETFGNNSKDSTLEEFRAVFTTLKDNRLVPSSWFIRYPINSTILKASLKLAWGNIGDINCDNATDPRHKTFRDKYWNVYLEIFKSYVQDLKSCSTWKGFFEKDGRLYFYERGKPRFLGSNAWHPTVQDWWSENVKT